MATPLGTIHSGFHAAALAHPETIAVVCEARALTYAELQRRSDQLAWYLLERGVKPGDRVGMYTQRSLEAVIAMLAILKAGAAYVPFDPSYPAKLLDFIHRDCTPAMMLIQDVPCGTDRPPFHGEAAVDIATAVIAAESLSPRPLPLVDAEAVAYIMYTSGSTGQPKGVLVPHRGVVRLVVDNHFAEVGSAQVHLQLAPLAFDASTFEIWGALLNGGRLAILPTVHPSLDDVARALSQYGVTTLWLTAGLFHLMVDHRLDGLLPLRQLLAGGDVLSPPHVSKALAGLPQCRLINGYGPTENTTFTCCYTIPKDYVGGAVPIGRPIARTEVFILDDARAEVADGEPGELYAGGAGVGLGYLNRPELNAERFIARPPHLPGHGLLYRTGDRVRKRPDGNLEFLGRTDRQVKINGKRVELDEIESHLRRGPAVEDAAVVSPAGDGVVRKIHAYVKFKSGLGASIEPLKAYLKAEMPDYMQPASLTVLEQLPLSPTGKVDRGKLPLPNAASSGIAPLPGAVSSPADATQSALLQVWRSVLGTAEIGLDDNFFDLGGTSLQLLKVHATISAVMQTDLTIVDLFQYPNIRALAARVARGAATGATPEIAATGNSTVASLSAADRARLRQAALSRVRAVPRRGQP